MKEQEPYYLQPKDLFPVTGLFRHSYRCAHIDLRGQTIPERISTQMGVLIRGVILGAWNYITVGIPIVVGNELVSKLLDK